ncbi:uncharacterized protein [Blastocystis hominis]|uniref:Vesicle transport protein n=1 Tax=Blastocystis hominis TaxID=12968 RepID=D8LVI8_BLAHO|nr:uncharacterized protein [Blastocystis hominis]CBK19827.2 unnamed protein product [Blastocystis hominis]|eukprot:XP_012893875.1 uncharacterized protein [Blastocystis hominis]
MEEGQNWVDESTISANQLWSSSQLNIRDVKEESDDEEKPQNQQRYTESLQSNFYFYAFLMISIASYAIAMLKYFPNIENQCQFYSFWMGFGSISCIAAVAQFEGYGQFFGRLFEKRILPLSLCFCLSLFGCIFSGLRNQCFVSVINSIIQCLCLVILFSLYTSTPFTFFLSNNTTAVRLALGPFAVQKAKD